MDTIQHPRRTHHFDQTLFQSIDQPWKAHFLGWLFSDGNIDRKLQRITLGLAESDREVLEYFAMKIYGSTAILRANKPHMFAAVNGCGKMYTAQAQHVLRINSVVVARDLLAKGLVPAKSLILRFPTVEAVPPHLVWHFVRGYFEGDGHVRKPRNHGRSDVHLLGTKPFMEALEKILHNVGITSTTISPKGRIWKLYIYGRENLVRFYNLIYKDADYSLQRKRERFEVVFKQRDVARASNRTSKYSGVHYLARTECWIARGTVNRVRHHIGCYPTEIEAHHAQIAFLKAHHVYEEVAA